MPMRWKLSNAGLALVLFATLSVLATASAAADKYEINVILPQTGGASFLGKAEQHTFELLQKSVNASGGIQGRPLQFNYFDDQSNPQTALQMANQVLASRPSVIIGPSIVAMCNAVAPLMVNGPVATTDGNMTFAQMKQYAAFLPKELYFPAGLWAAQGPSVNVPPEVKEAQEELYAAFRAENAAPDAAANHSWGPGMVVIDALKKLGPNATAVQVRDYLASLKSYPGINGVYNYEAVPQRGLSVQNAVVTRWDAAKQRWETMSQPSGIPLAQ